MKNTKTKGLLLGLAMVASVASVGYASWLVTAGASGNAEGNITAETVTDNIIKFENVKFSATTIHYGHDSTKTGPDWLKNSGGKASVLSTTLTFTVKGLQEGDTVVIGDLTEDTTNTYAAASNAGVVGDLPKGVTLTATNSGLTGLNSGVTGSLSDGFTVNYTYTFKWGAKFGNETPEQFFTGKKVDGTDLSSENMTWGAYAVKYLGEVAKVNNAKFTTTITATPKKTA